MGRRRINPLNYQQITEQAEKTIAVLMKQAHVKENSEATKERAVSRSFGAYMLWSDLTKSYPTAAEDDNRIFKLLVVKE